MFLLKAKVARQKTEAYGEKSSLVERAGGGGRYPGHWPACRD
jgi:hypothetical protein